MKKLLMASIALSVLTLAACNNDEEKEKEQLEAIEEIDYTSAASSYKAELMPILTSFVEDVSLLQSYIQEGKAEEATKLYPLVHMYVERLKPLQGNFTEQFEKIDAQVVEGKELEASGLHAIEYALFVKKDVKIVIDTASQLLEDVTALTSEAATTTLDGKAILSDASTMLKDAVEKTLSSDKNNFANSQVYDVQANLEAIEQVMNAYAAHAEEASEKALQQQLDKTLEAVAYYEVGKEDYVNYSYFTSKQKQDLINAFKVTKEAFDEYIRLMK